MIYTELTNKAMRIAYDAHHGQFDKSGQPYICHPLHLAEQMTDEITACAALLHDVAEDTDITLDDLAKEFPEEVIDVLRLLTHEDGTDYYEYVRGIKGNPAAMAVKLADIAHNYDQTRFAGCAEVSEEQLIYWQKKYEKAVAILLENDEK